MPGPIPKRSEERRRRNKDGVDVLVVDLDKTLAAEVEIPAYDPDWHPIAINWYLSLTQSGQAIFYEASDWSTAYILGESLSRELLPHDVKVGEREVVEITGTDDDGKPIILAGKDYLFEKKVETMSAATLTALLKGMSSLMTTEGERRRLRIELNRQERIDAALGQKGDNVVDIVKDRDSLFAGASRG